HARQTRPINRTLSRTPVPLAIHRHPSGCSAWGAYPQLRGGGLTDFKFAEEVVPFHGTFIPANLKSVSPTPLFVGRAATDMHPSLCHVYVRCSGAGNMIVRRLASRKKYSCLTRYRARTTWRSHRSADSA